MTEKRFTVIDHNEWAEGDVIYYDNGEVMGWLDVCDKLNEYEKENGQLKKENEVLKYKLQCMGVSDFKYGGVRYSTGLCGDLDD